MRKITFFFFLFFIFAVAMVATVEASAWRYLGFCGSGDELCRVMQGNREMVRHMRTGYMGYYNDGGVFYATHNSSGRPLSRPVKIAIGTGIGASLGAGIGDLLGHGREGALIGAGLGAIFGAKHGKNKNQSQDGMIPVEIDQAYRPISNPDDVVGSNKEKTFWPVKNRSGFRVELWTGNDFAGLLQPSETIRIENPDGMTAVMLVPGPGGTVQKVRGEVAPNHEFNGWDIVVPTEGVK